MSGNGVFRRLGVIALQLFIWITLDLAAGREYCWKAFNVSCAADEVIVMHKAKYGRMKHGTCIERNYMIGCQDDILKAMDRRCSGRHSCLVKIPNDAFHLLQPCPKDLLVYLDADYSCAKVAFRNIPSYCYQTSYEDNLVLTSQEGNLSNIVASETGYGSPNCPWQIRVQPGQVINISLLDFALTGTVMDDTWECPKYATIRETGKDGLETAVPVCGGKRRWKRIFLSQTNTVQVEIMQDATDARPLFMLQYEAVGCPDLTPPLGGWLQRVTDTVTVGCNSSRETWHMVCSGRKWVGQAGNCTGYKPKSLSASSEPARSKFPLGLVFAILIGVILGVILGVLLLVIFMACRKRLRRSRTKKLITSAKPHPVAPASKATKSQRISDYGTDQWELQQLKSGGVQTVGICPAHGQPKSDKTQRVNQRNVTLQTFRPAERIYESPQFEAEHGDRADCPFYHQFDSSTKSMTGLNQANEDNSSSEEARYTN